MEYKGGIENLESELKIDNKDKPSKEGPIIQTYSTFNCEIEFENLRNFVQFRQFSKARDLLVKFGTALRCTVQYHQAFVDFGVPQILFDFGKMDETSLSSAALFVIGNIIKQRGTEFFDNLDYDMVKEVISFNIENPKVEIANSVFCCLLGMILVDPDDCKDFFCSMEPSFVETTILLIVPLSVTNYGMKFIIALLGRFYEDSELAEHCLSMAIDLLQEIPPENPSMEYSISIIEFCIDNCFEVFERVRDDYDLCENLCAILKNFPTDLRARIMVIISNCSEIPKSFETETFFELLSDDDVETRTFTLFSIGKLVLHYPELLSNFDGYGIIDSLLERVASCQQKEKNEIIFVLAAYAKNGTNEQKLHLIENDFIEIIMENVEMKEFYDLVIDCVISLVRAFEKTEGNEKALDLCDENGIPDLIDNAINGEDPEIASRAEQFKAELNVDDDSDGD